MKGDQGATWCVIILQPDCSRWSHQSSCSFLWTIWIQDPIPWMPGEMLETSSSHRLTYRNKVGEVLAKPSGRWAPASLLKRPTIGKCSLPHNKTLTTAYKSQASMLQHIGREFTHYIHNNILYFYVYIISIYLYVANDISHWNHLQVWNPSSVALLTMGRARAQPKHPRIFIIDDNCPFAWQIKESTFLWEMNHFRVVWKFPA